MRKASHSLALVAILGLVGCGGPYVPVEGKIVYGDGSAAKELKEGTVEFEAVDQKISARGGIDAEGRFRMTTERSGDGCVPGKHRVVVTHRPSYADQPVPQVIRPKYRAFETSGLEVVIEAGKFVELKVERIKGSR